MAKAQSKLKVAIVHDWLIGGGAERVVEELHKIFPDAPIYTSYCTDEWRKRLDGKVITGYLQRLGGIRKFLPPLRALWFSRLDLSDYGLVISSSGAEAKFIKIAKPAVHVAYIHAPTHYYWARYDEYMKNPGFGWLDPIARLGLKLLVGPMRRLDYKAAQRPDYLIANSSFTKEQINKYYGRDALVIHPPVDVDRFKILNKSSSSRRGFIIAGRQTPYKRFDLAVLACTELGLPLTVLGSGPDSKRLKKMAGSSIKFAGWVSNDEQVKLFQSAEAFLFPGIDDFGVVAVEALASGTPVIAYKAGGALDYVTKDTGLFFDELNADSLVRTLRDFKSKNFDHGLIAKHAAQFSVASFRTNFLEFLKKL